MKPRTLLIGAVLTLTSARPAPADVQVYVNRFLDWWIASQVAGRRDPRWIDFETLPDGRRSSGWTPLTPAYNYTNQGVTFSPLFSPDLFGIGGNTQSGFDLLAISNYPPFRAAIAADLAVPTPAVAAFFPGTTELSIYDGSGGLLARQYAGGIGGGWFIGIVSTTPIARLVADRGADAEGITDFLFVPIPEPNSVALWLLAIGAMLITRRIRGP